MRFAFRFDPVWRPGLALLGVTPATSGVEVTDELLDVRFGPWRLVTPRSNVASAEVTGPWRAHRAIGPRYSLADHGVTFGSSVVATTLVVLHEPVPALLPVAVPRHPSVTLSVVDPGALAEVLDPTAAVGEPAGGGA